MKRWLIVVIADLLLAALVLILQRDDAVTKAMPDGSSLTFSGVQVGQSNVYTHGTGLAKLLGDLVPSNGVSVARYKLQRSRTLRMPSMEGGELLTAELQLTGPSKPPPLVSPPFYRKYRLLISGDRDEYFFVKEINAFKPFDDGWLAHLWCSSFPRDSRLLHFRLQERDSHDTRDWHEVATFDAKNPKPARVESWKADTLPRFHLPDDLEVEVGGLTMRNKPIHPTDIWENTTELPIRITRHGQTITNWGILESKMKDASGNFDSLPVMGKLMTNDWMVYRIFRPLDPAWPWRFQARIGSDSDFPATNLHSLVIPFPLAGPVQTNLGGYACRIEFVNAMMLSVQLTDKPSAVRMSFVSAVDNYGQNIDDRAGLWGQHGFWRQMKRNSPAEIRATVAIRPEHEIQFTLQPRREK